MNEPLKIYLCYLIDIGNTDYTALNDFDIKEAVLNND